VRVAPRSRSLAQVFHAHSGEFVGRWWLQRLRRPRSSAWSPTVPACAAA
jgi:hypothetical protein